MKRLILTLTTALVSTMAAVLVFGLSGCQTTTGSEEPAEEPPPTTGSEFSDANASAPVVEPEPEVQVAAELPALSIDPVHFDFDRSEIRADAVATLKSAARQLADGERKVVISGHCDNRGSEEYNLALGERRAAAVRRYLSNLGVSMRQMTIVSYGEIRPVAAGNTETAWSLNRRAEFESAD